MKQFIKTVGLNMTIGLIVTWTFGVWAIIDNFVYGDMGTGFVSQGELGVLVIVLASLGTVGKYQKEIDKDK